MKSLKSAFALLQKIGKSLMLPVAVLPVAGILLGVGSAHLTWIPEAVSTIMAQGGGAIFGSLPLIFAISVAVGLTDNDGVAALAATVGFVVLLATMGVMAKLFGLEPESIMGFETMNTGVFGGMFIGGIAAFLFKRYYRIQLPQYLGFFGGKRFVPIVTAFAAIALGMVLSLMWPPIQKVIKEFSHFAAYSNPTLAATVYAFVERLLIPFGLHHIWNVPFFVEIGQFTDATGKVVTGDINRFFAGDPTAGILGGAYLFKMWGLPAAAFAMWHTAKPENKAKVGSIMVSAALTSFLTGITEPIEFAFMFVAPLLYLTHAVLAAGSQLLFGMLGAKLGFTFSQGFIDYILYFHMDTKPWLVLVIGPLFGLLYYGVFRTMILHFDLKTPGRELDDAQFAEAGAVGASTAGALATAGAGAAATTGSMSKGLALIRAFGGRNNIKSLDACITRLRVELHDLNKLNVDRLKALGATGVLTIGQSAQAIFGPLSENLKSDMEDVIKANPAGIDEADLPVAAVPASPAATVAAAVQGTDPEMKRKISIWETALGGRENLTVIEPVASTRVRLVLKDPSKIDESSLRAAGVQAVLRLQDETVHLLVGLMAPAYAETLSTAGKQS